MSITINTNILTNVKYSKAYGVVFKNLNNTGDVVTAVREFVLPKIGNVAYMDSSICELINTSTTANYHNGSLMDDTVTFSTIITQEFEGFLNDTNVPITIGIPHYVFIVTMDGINETSVNVTRVFTDYIVNGSLRATLDLSKITALANINTSNDTGLSYYSIAFTSEQEVNTVVDSMNTYSSATIKSATTYTGVVDDALIELSSVVDNSGVTGNVVPLLRVNAGYVYTVVGMGATIETVGGTAFDIENARIQAPDDRPHVMLMSLTKPTSAASGIVVTEGYMFSSISNILKYYVLVFVTNAPSGNTFIDNNSLSEGNVCDFVNAHLETMVGLSNGNNTTLFGASASQNVVYYKNTGVPNKCAVGSIDADVTIHRAFNDLSSTSMVDVTDALNWSFTTFIVAIDDNMRCGAASLYVSNTFYLDDTRVPSDQIIDFTGAITSNGTSLFQPEGHDFVVYPYFVDGTKSFTVTFWAKINSLWAIDFVTDGTINHAAYGAHKFLNIKSHSAGYEFSYKKYVDGTLTFFSTHQGWGTVHHTTLIFYAVTYNVDTDTFTAFVNNNTTTMNVPGFSTDGGPTTGYVHFRGFASSYNTVDDVRIYNGVAKTATEINEIKLNRMNHY